VRRRCCLDSAKRKRPRERAGIAQAASAWKTEHRDLDELTLYNVWINDQLQIARLKKRKLLLKDQIAMVEDADPRYYRLTLGLRPTLIFCGNSTIADSILIR
jgi:hypothetical protein